MLDDARLPSGPESVRTGRLTTLNDWLMKNRAMLAWQMPSARNVPATSCYLIRSVPVIVCTFRDDRGWELFVPSAPHQNSIAASLTAATAAIGNGCLGPDDPNPEE